MRLLEWLCCTAVLLCGVATAKSLPLQERPWTLQAWGTPAPQAEAAPNEACATEGGSTRSYFFSKVRKGGGDAELIIGGVLQPGRAYEFSVPVRLSRGTGAVDVYFRRDTAYYETTSIKTVSVSPQWQTVTVRGVYDAPRPGSVRLGLRQDGMAVCVGQPTLREIAPDLVGAAPGWHDVPKHFLGIHLNKLGRHNNWPSFEPGVVRLWGSATTWGELHSKRSRVDWRDAHGTRLEYFVRHTLQRGRDASVMMTLGMTPVWASVKGDNGACARSSFGERSCMPPADLATWRAFVRELAERYADGRIAIWELWNEADVPTHWVGTPQLMVEMARIAREEIKKVNPDAVLIGPNVTAIGLRFLNDFLVHGGGRYVDGLSIHVYLGLGSRQAMSRMRNAREVMRGHGVALPIWNTESNTACIDDPDPGVYRQAGMCDRQREATVMQAVLLHAAQGFENFTFYTWEGAELEINGVGMVQEDFRTKTLLGRLYDDVARMLRGGAVRMLPAMGDITRVQWRKGGRDCILAWANQGTAQAVPGVFGDAVVVTELGGRALDRDMAGVWSLGVMPAMGCPPAGSASF